jgi:Fe2+ transport system protein FeoA
MPNIKAVFDDPRTTSRAPATLAKRAGTSAKAAAGFLRDQAAAQITRRATRPPDDAFAPTGGPRGEYLADVVYLRDYAGVNNKRTCILTLLGANSRFAYAEALTAATAPKTAEAMKRILTRNAGDARGGVVAPIEKIRSDGGPEFAGEFAALLKARGIPLEKGQPGTHARLGRLDRFHGVLRRKIGELFARRDSHVWVDVLQDLIDNHNASPSRPLKAAGKGLAPADINQGAEGKLRATDLDRASALRQRVDTMGIGPGTMVRLLTARLKKAPRFVKGQQATWTPELYPVVGRAGVNTFRIDVPAGENAIWGAHEVQIVRKALGQPQAAGPKINKAVVAAQRLEALNISPAEQAANIAAVAHAPAPAGPLRRSGRIAAAAVAPVSTAPKSVPVSTPRPPAPASTAPQPVPRRSARLAASR